MDQTPRTSVTEPGVCQQRHPGSLEFQSRLERTTLPTPWEGGTRTLSKLVP